MKKKYPLRLHDYFTRTFHYFLPVLLFLILCNCHNLITKKSQRYGNRFLKSGELDKAIDAFKAASAYETLANIHTHLNDYDTALSFLSRVKPVTPRLLFKTGRFHAAIGHWRKAKIYFLEAHEQKIPLADPTRLHFYLAFASEKLYQYPDAIKHYTHIIRINPNLGGFPLTPDSILNRFFPNPDMADVYYRLAVVYNKTGATGKASHSIRAIFQGKRLPSLFDLIPVPRNKTHRRRLFAKANLLLAAIYNKQEKYQEANTCLQKFKRNMHLFVSSPLPLTWEREKQITELKQRISRKKQDECTKDFYQLGHLYFFNDDFNEASRFYNKVLNISPTDYDSLLGLGQVAAATQRFREAILKYESVIKLYPGKHKGYLLVGLCYFSAQEYPRAVEALTRSHIMEPSNLRNLEMLGVAHYKLRQYSKTIQYLKKFLALKKKAPIVAFYLGLSYLNLGNYDEAHTYFLSSACTLNVELRCISKVFIRKVKALKNGDFFFSRELKTFRLPY